MAEIAFLIIAIALAAFLIALIPTLLRTRHVVKEVEETVAVLRTDINEPFIKQMKSWLRQTSWLKMLMKKFKQSILSS